MELESPALRGAVPPVHMEENTFTDLYSDKESFKSIQESIITLCKQRELPDGALHKLQEEVQLLLKTKAGQFLPQFYEDRLLMKGLRILREEVKDLEGLELLEALSRLWSYFLGRVLPCLQAMLLNLYAPNEALRQTTLRAFGAEILMKIPLAESLSLVGDSGPPAGQLLKPAMTQMLLISLSAYKEKDENCLRMTELAALCISPLVSPLGVFYNGKVRGHTITKHITSPSAMSLKRRTPSVLPKHLLQSRGSMGSIGVSLVSGTALDIYNGSSPLLDTRGRGSVGDILPSTLKHRSGIPPSIKMSYHGHQEVKRSLTQSYILPMDEHLSGSDDVRQLVYNEHNDQSRVFPNQARLAVNQGLGQHHDPVLPGYGHRVVTQTTGPRNEHTVRQTSQPLLLFSDIEPRERPARSNSLGDIV